MTVEKKHYVGHRQRTKEKLLNIGHENMSDYELLELLLMIAIPRIDVKPLSKLLLEKFGSYKNVIFASEDSLKEFKGVSDNTIAVLKIVQDSIIRTLKDDLKENVIINNWEKLINYCKSITCGLDVEQFRILYLNTKFHLIKDDIQQAGTVNYAAVYPREIIKKALSLNAHSIILLHNHPSGDPTPSIADIDITQKIKMALNSVDITLHDHLILGKSGEYFSLKREDVL